MSLAATQFSLKFHILNKDVYKYYAYAHQLLGHSNMYYQFDSDIYCILLFMTIASTPFVIETSHFTRRCIWLAYIKVVGKLVRPACYAYFLAYSSLCSL